MADQDPIQDPSEVETAEQVETSQATPEEMEPEAVSDSELAIAQEEIATLKDQLQRTLADNQNVRRRAEQDVEKAHKFGVEKLIKELLPVVDNLERALASAPEEQDEALKAVLEGVSMTHKSFIDGLEKYQVAVIDPEGEPFNPEEHQAMSMVEAPDAEPNTVLAVVQKGYSLHGRLLRPAMVMVSKSPAKVDEQA